MHKVYWSPISKYCETFRRPFIQLSFLLGKINLNPILPAGSYSQFVYTNIINIMFKSFAKILHNFIIILHRVVNALS